MANHAHVERTANESKVSKMNPVAFVVSAVKCKARFAPSHA